MRRAAQPEVLPLAAAAGPIACLVASAAAPHHLLAAAAGPTVLLLDTAHGTTTPLRADASAHKPIACLAASADGSLVAAGARGAKPGLWLWRLSGSDGGDAPQGQELARGLHNFGIAALSFSPNGRLLASHGADKDAQLALWDAIDGKPLGRVKSKESYDGIQLVTGGAEPVGRLLCVNPAALVVWGLERCATPGGSLKLTRLSSYALPALASPKAGMVGLAALPPSAANPRAPLRLVTCSTDGKLLRLRASGPAVEKAADVQAGKVLALAASPDCVAVACATGEVKLYSAATLELAAVLPPPPGTAACAAAALAFRSGDQLVASYRGGGGGGGAAVSTWVLRDLQRPALLSASLCASHSEPVTDAVLVPTPADADELVATCGLDGRIQLWSCSAAGAALTCTAPLDVRPLLGAAPAKLACLAASPDGQLLAAGDSSGSVHLISLALPAAPFALCSVAVHSGFDITSLAFAAAGSGLLLAAGSRRGGVALMRCQQGGACMPLAALADHKAAVTGLVLSSSGGGATLTSAGADGKRLTYSWGEATGQLHIQAQAEAPRCSFVGLAPASVGEAAVAVAASRGGRVSWEAAGPEVSVQAVDKRQGELACFAVDASLSLLACATSRNQLLVHRLAGGKAALIASCKAHTAGSAVSKVLILPRSGCILSVGEDATVCSNRLPGAAAASRSEPALRLSASTAQQASASKPASSGGSPSAPIQPRDLSAALCSADGCAALPAEAAPAEAAGPLSAAADEAQLLAAPAEAAPAEADVGAGVRRSAASCSIPPSPNRQAKLADLPRQQHELAELQAQWQAAQQARASKVEEVPAPPQPPAPAPHGTPMAAAAAAPGLRAPSPGFAWASPLETVSSISLGGLQSPAAQSPDIFAHLETPSAAGAGATPSPPPASPPAEPAHAQAAPPSGGSAKSKSKLGRLTASALDRLKRQVRSPFAASSKAAAPAAASPSSQGVGAALDAADAVRCSALLQLSSDGHGAAPAGGAAAPEPAFFSPGSVTVDLADAQSSQPGSISVDQPGARSKRRSWGPVPGSAGPRRSASALEPFSSPLALGSGDLRTRSALDLTADSFGIYADAASSAGGKPPGASPGSSGGLTSRRLSFSFGGGCGGKARTAARSASQPEAEGNTPTFMGGKPAAAAPLPAFINPAEYVSPGLRPQGQPADTDTDSTPRLFMGSQAAKPAVAAGGAAKAAASAAKPAAWPPAAAQRAAPAAAAHHAGSGSTAQPEPPKPRGLQGRPAVPRLNLAFAKAHFAGAGPRPAAAAAAKRPRQGPPPAASPAESSASTASGGAGGLAAHQTALAEEESAGKKPRPAMSPPRRVFNSELYEHSAAKPRTAASRRLSSPEALSCVSGCSSAQPSPALDSPLSDDPFSRPAAHDPLADEDAPAAGPVPATAAAMAAPPAAQPAAQLAASPAATACTSPEAAPSPQATEGSSDSKAAEEPAATPAAALGLLRQGAAMLAGLGSGALDAPALAQLAPLVVQLQQLLPAPAAPPAAAKPAPPVPSSSSGRENVRSNGEAIGRADLASMKKEILQELRAELLQELRASLS